LADGFSKLPSCLSSPAAKITNPTAIVYNIIYSSWMAGPALSGRASRARLTRCRPPARRRSYC
jgi:hypothetical protein